MSMKNCIKFPSGISVERAKKDAKKLSRRNNISHNQALDIIAQSAMNDVPCYVNSSFSCRVSWSWSSAVQALNARINRLTIDHEKLRSIRELLISMYVADESAYFEVSCSGDSHIERASGTSYMWPRRIFLPQSICDEVAEVFNDLSLLDFELSLIGSDADVIDGNLIVEMWGDSICPFYQVSPDSVHDHDIDIDEHIQNLDDAVSCIDRFLNNA